MRPPSSQPVALVLLEDTIRPDAQEIFQFFADQGELTRQKRKRDPLDPDDGGQQDRIHRFRNEEVGHPLDVVDDPPPLSQDLRQRRELIVEQHELRYTPTRCAPVPHGYSHVGVLQCQHIVNSVPGHGHDMISRLKRSDHRLLLMGRDSAEHRG